MNTYLPGETVNITLAYARVLEHEHGASLTVEVGGHRLTVPLGPGTTTTVDRYRPADGWPEPGEIWSDADGWLWAAVGDREHAGVWLIHVQSGERMGVGELNMMSGPLRRIWRPTGETTNGGGSGA